MWTFFHKLASPQYFYHFAGRVIPWVATLTIVLFIMGLILGLWVAPPDYQQGDAFRIIYIHVPCAAMSLLIYSVMSGCAVVILVWRLKLAEVILNISAPLGAWMTFLALVTGAIWGKPMWGTWWIWDARLTSELILLFLYFGIIALSQAIRDANAASKVVAVMVLVGFADIPIIHYSVKWWNTLHQGSTLLSFAKPSIAPVMLYPLLCMIAAFTSYYVWLVLQRSRIAVLSREKQSQWVKKILCLN